MTTQPLAYHRAASASLRMWYKRDQVIEDGLNTRQMDYAMVNEMERAAVMLRQLSERLYEAWQTRGGQSNDLGRYTLPGPVVEETEAEHRLDEACVRYSGAW